MWRVKFLEEVKYALRCKGYLKMKNKNLWFLKTKNIILYLS